MNEVREFLESGGKRGCIEYLRIDPKTHAVFIDRFKYSEFIYDAVSDTTIAVAMGLLTSGQIGLQCFIDALEDYAYYQYVDEVEQHRKENEA